MNCSLGRTQERTGELALERIPVTQALLRVKKEEELQEAPGLGIERTTTPASDSEGTRRVGGGGCGVISNEAEITAKTIVPPFLLASRRTSPPPEDWKPLDKCYFCLDGKLPHDDQAPLVSNHFDVVPFLDISFVESKVLLLAKIYFHIATIRKKRWTSLPITLSQLASARLSSLNSALIALTLLGLYKRFRKATC